VVEPSGESTELIKFFVGEDEDSVGEEVETIECFHNGV
jgi:hypothetical protein